jgi:hypothetical protein
VLAGVGQTWVDYPAFAVQQPSVVNPQNSADLGLLSSRSGKFIEVPLGLGIGYQPFKPFHVDLGFTYRPGFSFKGDAYEVSTGFEPYRQSTGGWSVTLGISMGL